MLRFGKGKKPKRVAKTSPVSSTQGISVLHEGEDIVVDIIFVHGLTGDRVDTWKGQSSNAPWPQTILPRKIRNCRILTFGYDAGVAKLYGRGKVSQNRLWHHAMNLLNDIARYRISTEEAARPIFFVCHSLGGLLCKDALVQSKDSASKHLHDISEYTRGIIFAGTPHRGAPKVSYLDVLTKMVESVGLGLVSANPHILEVLKSDSDTLTRINDNFMKLLLKRTPPSPAAIEITCFHEELETKGLGMIVPSQSALIDGHDHYTIARTHADMTKFDTEDDVGFQRIAGELSRWTNKIKEESVSASPMTDNPVISRLSRSATLPTVTSQRLATVCHMNSQRLVDTCNVVRGKSQNMEFPKKFLGDLISLRTKLSILGIYLGRLGQASITKSFNSCLRNCDKTINNLEGTINRYSGIRSELNDILKLQRAISKINSSLSDAVRRDDISECGQSMITESSTEFSSEPASNLGMNELLVEHIHTMLAILSNSDMGRSIHREKENTDFIRTWLENHSKPMPSGLDTLRNDVDNVPEAWGLVPCKVSSGIDCRGPVMDGKNFDSQIFDFGNFNEHFVVNVSVPRSVSSRMNTEYQHLPECSKRRYTAITGAAADFSRSGFQLRQTILGRSIDRLVAVKVNEDISSDELTAKLSRVTKDVRDLLQHCGALEDWQYIVIGVFCRYRKKTVTSRGPREDSILYRLGLLAEFPVEVNFEHDDPHHYLGLVRPTSVRFDGMGHSSSLARKEFVTAHLHEFTTTLAPSGLSSVETSSIPLQLLLCLGDSEQDAWIKAMWGALRATRCFLYQEEADTGGTNYKLIHKELAWDC